MDDSAWYHTCGFCGERWHELEGGCKNRKQHYLDEVARYNDWLANFIGPHRQSWQQRLKAKIQRMNNSEVTK